MKPKSKYVFATNNLHKLEEVRQIAGEEIEILSLEDIGFTDEIVEDAPTLEGNARKKALAVAKNCAYPCFADDTGLEVEALNGAPGVHTARYAGGDGHDSIANMQRLLDDLKSTGNRMARFRTAIVLIDGEKEFLFEGIVNGNIASAPVGDGGFGYDPIFIPEGDTRSFAQYSPAEKNSISHRGHAVKALMNFLNHS